MSSWSALKRLVRPGAERYRASRAKDAAVVIGNLPRLLGNIYRRVARRQAPIQRIDEPSLYCSVEQTPNPLSRVTLGQQTDALGMPLLRVDWRIGELERRSVMRLNELVGAELRRVGLPEYIPNKHLSDDVDWRSQFIDRAHSSGRLECQILREKEL